jgi:NAD(P)-dependent dehydrogenase (short-subunit alcohol dehydrogenase family)
MERGAPVKNVLVIGGTSGIGQGIVDEVAVRGHVVYGVGPDQGVDVLLAHTMEKAINEYNATHVVYCAGINRLRWMRDLNRDEMEDLFNVNVFGFAMMMQIVARHSRVRSVLAVSSDAAVRPMRTSLAYCASKAALNMAVRVAARELAPNVRVNAIAPGKVADTPMTEYVDRKVPQLRGWTPEYAADYERLSSPIGRALRVDEVAEAAADILLNTSPGYTGEIVTVNGGR